MDMFVLGYFRKKLEDKYIGSWLSNGKKASNIYFKMESVKNRAQRSETIYFTGHILEKQGTCAV